MENSVNGLDKNREMIDFENNLSKQYYGQENETVFVVWDAILENQTRKITIPQDTQRIIGLDTWCERTKIDFKGTVEDWCRIVIDNHDNYDRKRKTYYKHPHQTSHGRRFVQLLGGIAKIFCRSLGYQLYINEKRVKNLIIPDTMSQISDNAFSSCISLKKVVLPDSIITIGKGAFNECHYLNSVSLGKNVSTIEERAFTDCYSLKYLSIPMSVNHIAKDALEGCVNLTKICYEGTVEEWLKLYQSPYDWCKFTVACSDGKISYKMKG